MHTVVVARLAMATRFEMVLHGGNAVALRAAAEAALDEIERLEAQLSLHRATSEIHHLNSRATHEPVRVSPDLFRLLEHARRLHEETDGAFDITIAPLMRCWGFLGGSGAMPSPEQVAAARESVGMHLVELDESHFTVHFAHPGVKLDLGAIGKGYALARAVAVLLEAGVASALVHGGTSSVHALGAPPDAAAWRVAIAQPAADGARPAVPALQSPAEAPEFMAKEFLAVVPLKDASLSVSAPSGKFFAEDGKIFGHVLDPRTGYPAQGALLAAVVLPSATEADALSTALLTLGPAGHTKIAALRSGMKTWLATRAETGGEFQVESMGE